MIDGNSGKGAAYRTHNGGEERGRDIGEEKEGRNRSGRQEDTTRRKGSACRSGVGAAPRARIYIISYILYIYIYIIYISII